MLIFSFKGFLHFHLIFEQLLHTTELNQSVSQFVSRCLMFDAHSTFNAKHRQRRQQQQKLLRSLKSARLQLH